MSTTPDSSYSPQAGSFAALVCIYFKSNSDEALSRTDIATKFEVAASSIDSRLAQCISTELLKVRHDTDLGRVWSAGPRLRNWMPGNNTQTLPSARGGIRQRLPMLDASTLTVVAGAPIPSHGLAAKGATAYDAIFDKLDKPDMAVTGIDSRYANTLAKAAMTYCKSRPLMKLKVRRIPGTTTCGVWRLP